MGLAAGTVTLGTAADSALADGTYDRVVAASDVHFGSPYSNPDAFVQFLTETVPALDPDLLVLNGDIFEFWYRGMSSVLLEYNHITTQFEALASSGTEIALVAGNHDRRLVDVGHADYDAATLDAPWRIDEAFTFESGDRSFVAVHGDGPDPKQQDGVSSLLCAGSDRLGKVIVDFSEAVSGNDLGTRSAEDHWSQLTDDLDAAVVPAEAPPVDGTDHEPTAASSRPRVAETVTNGLLETYDEFVLFGHTHYAELGERFVNTGAWTERGVTDYPDRPQNTFVQIDAGDVQVLEWSDDGTSVLFEE
ncbi:metallophosphoesterase [Natrialba chahannaoensis JCM 10990]|uniref:Metallophosphoesterase n=1 Tax=Natrialba chahannaoensis JCM 10990 TaxID=1227492 RepID=M0A6P4_9EURY|nr:metallophosphoesterase [Natrialba chahannaoensis]ELY93552.1 metallophosphoesterase [Natrialba chahannaoensis JCM 10990]